MANFVAMKPLGERVKEFRESRKWTAGRLAKEVGTSRQNIDNLEAGRVRRHPFYIHALARVMGASTDELLAGTPITSSGGSRLESSLSRLPADLAALLPQDAEAFSAEIAQLCERVHERAEQVRRHATLLQPAAELPTDIEDLKRELDALGPAERKIAYARAMNVISSPPLPPERAARPSLDEQPSPAVAPRSKPKVRR